MILIIIAVVLVIVGLLLYEKYRPTKERADLYEYFGITEADDVAVIRDREKTSYFGKLVDGHVYLPYETVHDSINDRFYIDQDGLLLYTFNQAELSYNLEAGGNDCLIQRFEGGSVTEETLHFEAQPVKYLNDKFYLELDFVKQYSPIEYTYYEEPSRIMLTTSFREIAVTPVTKDTAIREKGGIKSPILKDLFPGDMVYAKEEEENWVKVESTDGITGYVQKKHLGEETTETQTCSFQEEDFTHIFHEGTVNMLWHQVTNTDVNDQIGDVLASSKGVNVISPTWFYLNDNTGGVEDLSSRSYVDFCHERGIEVWALVSNLENGNVDDENILMHYGTRWNFVNTMVEKALSLGLDGINLDFEAISQEAGASYVQLVRELSLVCGSHGLIFSVDNYVPSEYTLHYDRGEQALFADYVVIMAYDEHYNGSDEGSVSSMPFVENGVKDTMDQEVPANQIILGMPFYTRIWEETPKTGASDLEMASNDYIPYELSSRAVGMDGQNEEINAHGAEVTYLADLGQNFSSWQEAGLTYKIWMEDMTSLTGRLEILKQNNLAGGAFWKSGLESSSVWDVIAEYLQ